MARPLSGRLRVKAVLEALVPLHVGGTGGDDLIDLPFSRDGSGRWYAAGSGLAGALRGWCERRFDGDLVNASWGFQQGRQGAASRIVVEDTQAHPPAGKSEVWPGIFIDRTSGTAAHGLLYEREVLPRGTRLELDLTADLPPDGSPVSAGRVKAMLGHLLTQLEPQREGIRLGGAKTRGNGRVRLLKEPWIAEEDWVTKQGTLAALAGSGRKVEVGELVGAATQDRPRSTAEHLIEIAWSPADPVMVAAGLDGLAVDFLPLVSATSACEIALVLPGSSIKGSLRTAGERIARTLLKRTAPPAILDQVKVPLVEDLFGSASDAEGAGRMGAVAVEPCYSEDRICRSTWDDVILAKDDGSLRTALNGTQLDIDQAYHVTIDRWTGGAFPHALFSALEPRVDWEKIRLWIDLDRVPEARREAATILLALTLRDLAEGFVPLGFATNRGYGTVKVEALSGLPNEIQLRPDGNSRRWRIDASEAKKKELRRAWEDWLAEVGATGERK